MTLVVTPELLRTTQNAITTALENAATIANGYLAEQQNINSTSTWSGAGVAASTNTATQINHDLQQTVIGGTRLAEGLGQAAVLMENHEDDAAQNFTGLFSSTTAV